jgi:hypothetical protein
LAQPNSEFDVYANMTDGRSVLLDTGRTTHRDFVGNTSDAAFQGTFRDWFGAYAVATTTTPLTLTSIRSFSVRMVRGRLPRGTIVGSDPFRGSDEWKINGFVVGVIAPMVAPLDARRVFGQYNIDAKLNAGHPAWTSALWH